jgi:methionyl-tRNA formyltransferase
MTPLRIIFAGSGEFGLPTLRGLLDAGHELALVISQPDRPAGRGRVLTPTPIGQFAIAKSLPLLRTPNINAEALPDADLLLVIAFGQKIGDALTKRPRLGSANLHASMLPLYRGAAPINWAILRGESLTGNTVIRLAPRMDAGAILGQSPLAINELETAGELHDRLAIEGAGLVLAVIDKLSSGRAQEWEQDDAYASTAPKLDRESARLDWTRPAAEVANRIRGLYPWPGCRVRVPGADGQSTRATLVRARAVNSTSANLSPGMIDAAGHIAAGSGTVEIVEIQPEGKRPMLLAAYRNGHAWNAGTQIMAEH